MSTQQVAALEGWYTLDANPALLGSQCIRCKTYYFPKQTYFCRNPECNSEDFNEVQLSRTGKIWSYTSASYQPPAPFVRTKEIFKPFTIAAVELEKEKMIVLGQMIPGITPQDLKIGDTVELVIDTLHKDQDEHGNTIDKVVWKWQPVK